MRSERRRQARAVKVGTAVTMASTIFHRNAKPIGEFRKSWHTATVRAGLGKMVCRICKHEGEEKSHCKKRCKYVGRTFYDFRRSGVRNLARAGVPQSVAMSISGHRTDATFKRLVSCRPQKTLREEKLSCLYVLVVRSTLPNGCVRFQELC